MSSLKALRVRIKSVKSTQKITKAMRLVAASKLNKARKDAEFARDYSNKLSELLHNLKNNHDISSNSPLVKSLFDENFVSKQTIIVIFGSDKGLCGPYNGSIYKKITKDLASIEGERKIVVVGKKLAEHLSEVINIDLEILSSEKPLEISKKLLNFVLEQYAIEPETKLVNYYTIFKNIMMQIPDSVSVLPIKEEREISNINVEFEGENLFDKLLSLYLEAKFIANYYQSKASEEASRMTAMDNASKNAGEMIDNLTLKMNRSRQAQITKELIEVISGAEAV